MNDTITIDELRFGDNDGLAQLIAIKMVADLLVFLTGVGGLFRLQFGNKPMSKDEIAGLMKKLQDEKIVSLAVATP